MPSKQVLLPSLSSLKKDAKFFGGSLLVGKRKAKRPFYAKKLYHLVLRSEMARGRYNMLKKARLIRKLVQRHAQQNHIEIVDFANVGNHLHLLIRSRGSAKLCFHPFIRSITGLIAREVLGAQKGKASHKQFWSTRPYTRLVHESRKSFGTLKRYFGVNKLESMGIKRERLAKKDPAALCFLSLVLEGPPAAATPEGSRFLL